VTIRAFDEFPEHQFEVDDVFDDCVSGYSEAFVDRGLAFVSEKLADYEIRTTSATLGAFARDNPDCNAKMMLQDILACLREVIESDGHIDEREEMAIERIETVFAEELSFSLTRVVAPVGLTVTSLANGALTGFTSLVGKPWSRRSEERDQAPSTKSDSDAC